MTQNPAFRHAGMAVQDGIATLTIQDARSLNILSAAVIADLTQAVNSLAQRDDIRVLIVRGTGDKAFTGGADIKEMAALTSATAEPFINALRALCDSVRYFPAPVIARIPGWCLGGGLEWVMACDFRIAADTAQFGMPEVKVGIPSVIHAALMPRLIGQAQARWMLLTGENINAQQALAWGLVNSVVPLAQLDAEVARVASMLAALGPAVLRQQKRLLREWEDAPLNDSIANSVTAFCGAFDTGEPQRYMGEFFARKGK